ncbi:hypothetical protein AB0I84_31755, partial [Streptomyces spectabilis]|uniref:hypothetical protein n=1 Tax=Streptomyces spectabilis TaxID=68270 RepID=UPI0033E3A5B6
MEGTSRETKTICVRDARRAVRDRARPRRGPRRRVGAADAGLAGGARARQHAARAAMAITKAKEEGAKAVICASTGNTSAS